MNAWIVDCGLWIVDCGLWIVDCGLWVVDCGLWIEGCGLRVVVLSDLRRRCLAEAAEAVEAAGPCSNSATRPTDMVRCEKNLISVEWTVGSAMTRAMLRQSSRFARVLSSVGLDPLRPPSDPLSGPLNVARLGLGSTWMIWWSVVTAAAASVVCLGPRV